MDERDGILVLIDLLHSSEEAVRETGRLAAEPSDEHLLVFYRRLGDSRPR